MAVMGRRLLEVVNGGQKSEYEYKRKKCLAALPYFIMLLGIWFSSPGSGRIKGTESNRGALKYSWPKTVVKKWLNIRTKLDEFHLDCNTRVSVRLLRLSLFVINFSEDLLSEGLF
ncbi:hypothetical protein J5N97_013097 [Dioscorea zingiberensis]|uniref:Uncharacterized protein n=1 Tax=Dioscorea zingiberensis TaxID=325984 RepID=A0A9D5CQL4_9LILI|nr:hypothetical protein J5N97_013097 [Dioscorea zingiberensis]